MCVLDAVFVVFDSTPVVWTQEKNLCTGGHGLRSVWVLEYGSKDVFGLQLPKQDGLVESYR